MSSLVNVIDKVVEDGVFYTLAANSVNVDVSGCSRLAISIVATPIAGGTPTFDFGPLNVNPVANTITKTAHGLLNYEVVQFQINNSGTLPSGLQESTDYRTLVLDANTFQVVSKDDITVIVSLGDSGSGTSTEFNCAGRELGDAVFYLGHSLDGINWEYDDGTPFNDVLYYYKEIVNPAWKFYQFDYEFGTGIIEVTSKVLGKGPA